MHRMTGQLPPAAVSPGLIDLPYQVPSDDAITMARRLAVEEGLFCGISSGAAVVAAVKVGPSMAGMVPRLRLVCSLVDVGVLVPKLAWHLLAYRECLFPKAI